MTCHPTDPNNPVSQAQQEAGHKVAPEHSKVRECAGALILLQREYMRFQAISQRIDALPEEDREHADAYREYKVAARTEQVTPMTRQALLGVAMRAINMPAVITGSDVPMNTNLDLSPRAGVQQ